MNYAGDKTLATPMFHESCDEEFKPSTGVIVRIERRGGKRKKRDGD
jgi:hypothetical protein